MVVAVPSAGTDSCPPGKAFPLSGKVISNATASPSRNPRAVRVNSVPTGPAAGSISTAPITAAGAAVGPVGPPNRPHPAAPEATTLTAARPDGASGQLYGAPRDRACASDPSDRASHAGPKERSRHLLLPPSRGVIVTLLSGASLRISVTLGTDAGRASHTVPVEDGFCRVRVKASEGLLRHGDGR